MARRSRLSLVVDPDADTVWFYVALRRGGWTAAYRLVSTNRRPVVVELRVFPTNGINIDIPLKVPPDPSGLTAALLKEEVVMGRHIYEMLPAWLRQVRNGVGSDPIKNTEGGVVTLYDSLLGCMFNPEVKPRHGRRGPKGWPDEEYARLASDYLTACKSGSRSPVADVAKARGTTVSALRATLNRARKRGLLTSQKGGRAGGQLTPQAKALLRPASS